MPNEWQSDREKPREPFFGHSGPKNEPFFGPEWPNALAYLISFAVVFSISYWLRH